MTWAWIALLIWIGAVILLVLEERRRERDEDPGVRELRERKERDWNL